MQSKNEFLIKVYEDGNIRIPIKIRNQLNIIKGSNLIIKLNNHGGMSVNTVDHKLDELRNEINKELSTNEGNTNLVNEFLEFKKQDNSKYV